MAEEVKKVFVAPVDYVQPAYEALCAAFDWVRDEYAFVTKVGFQPIDAVAGVVQEPREIAFEYVCLGRVASSEEVLAEMERQGLRPALYEELLAFAAKHRFEQVRHPIAALGSVCQCPDDTSAVGVLYSFGTKRDLRLHLFGESWAHFYRFLAVRK